METAQSVFRVLASNVLDLMAVRRGLSRVGEIIERKALREGWVII